MLNVYVLDTDMLVMSSPKGEVFILSTVFEESFGPFQGGRKCQLQLIRRKYKAGSSAWGHIMYHGEGWRQDRLRFPLRSFQPLCPQILLFWQQMSFSFLDFPLTTLTLRCILHLYCSLIRLEYKLEEGRHVRLVFFFSFLYLAFRIVPGHRRL